MSIARAPEPRELLRAAQVASGLPTEQWIHEVMIPACGPRAPHVRTVYRWLSGEVPVPEGVRRMVEGWVAHD